MANFIYTFFMTKKQRQMFKMADSGKVAHRTGYVLQNGERFSTNIFSAHTDMGIIRATYAHQEDYEMKPKNIYNVVMLTEVPGHAVQQTEYHGVFARTMYTKLKQRYEQGKQRAG